MEKKTGFVTYVTQQPKVIVLMLCLDLITGSVFYLYQLPYEAYVYIVLMGSMAGVVVMISGYHRWKDKMEMLKRLEIQPYCDRTWYPNASNVQEYYYQEAMLALKQQYDDDAAFHQKRWKEAKDYYTMWAHQIKTPIAAMRLLLQTEAQLDKRELEEELFRIEQYVEMVLSYLRMEDINTDLVLHKIQLYEIAREAVHKYSSSFIRKKIKLEFQPFSSVVLTDEKWSVFVIEQILSNALKYTKSGGTIRIMAEDEKLYISDTGIGIAKEDLPRVFERGFTGYNGRMEYKATGIGLYLCREIMEKLNHKISIESKPEKGTMVTIDFTTRKVEIE